MKNKKNDIFEIYLNVIHCIITNTMGIKSLSTILNQYSKNGIKYVTLDNFKGKVVSIDTSIYLYKFIYNNSDYLEGFTRQLLRLLKNVID